MKSPLLLFFVPLCLCAFAPPLTAGPAILWIPGEHAPLEDVISLLETGRDLKLTAALGKVSPELMARVTALSSQGRLEPAARPSGDPLIPLFYYAREDSVQWRNKPSDASYTNDPFFISLRMSDAREAYARQYKRPPEAFVSAPGGAVAGYIPLARALGFKWLAAGAPASATESYRVINAEGVRIVLFSTPTSHGFAPVADEPAFLVFDETLGQPGEETRAALLTFLSSAGNPPFMTVSEALQTAVSTAMPADQAALRTAPWSGDYTPWAGTPAQAGTLTAFTRTRGELMEYFNAKQGNYKAAEPAFAEYFSVESGPKLLRLAAPDTETASEAEIEIQNALVNSYRLMNKVPPGWLFSALSDIDDKTESEDKVAVKKSNAEFTLMNALRQPVPPDLPAAGAQDPYKIWKLTKVSVAWTDSEITFRFFPMETPAAAVFNTGARFDVYIDINNRPRAGTARPLDGRAGRLFPDDAWEYALTASPKNAALYAATGKGPQILKSFPASFSDGAVTVRIPRTELRGNPARWGYTAFMLYSADDKTFSIIDYLAEDLSNGYYYSIRPDKK